MNEQEKIFLSGMVAIIGLPNVGKSTLLNGLLGQKIAITSPKPQTTRNRILGVLHQDRGQILLLDTPGVHRAEGKLNRFMISQSLGACQEVDLVLYLVDATVPAKAEDEFILKHLERCGKPVFLVVNKVDAVSKPALLPLIDRLSRRFPFAEVVPVSGLKKDGLDDLVESIFRYLSPGPRYFPEDLVTDLPERFIVAELVREKVLLHTREEVPHGVAVTIEQFEEQAERDLVVIHAVIHVERATHKRIVVGKGGAMIRTIGQSARREIEILLGCRVYLELFVRVDERWTGSDRHLKEFGYQ